MTILRITTALSLALALPMAVRASAVSDVIGGLNSTASDQLSVRAKGGKGAKPHAAHAPRHSVHHSTPRHAAVHRPQVRHAVAAVKTRAFRHTHPAAKATVNRTNNRTVNRTVNTSGIANFASRPYYRRPNTYNAYYNTRYHHHRGYYNWRHSSYRRHRHHQRNANVVRGVVEGTSGVAANGSVQVKILRNHFGKFRNNKKGVANAKNFAIKNFSVNNGTRYQVMSGNNGGFLNGSFKSLKVGESVLMVLPNTRNQQANANVANLVPLIEIFPTGKKLAAN